ncbi:bifunctional 2-keto-4-hydroxyglutarate aldolase/2-keto-3-deoxy-6-phosphogluconate aldolase [Neobacillus sp. PS3-12]|jgi:2-dehydro-3-deoxyphosphogluconate aldolase / (4S)-4-hydroxy-2-oxoglutarate aldolase|uniref:bifunctional 2-keto-4-hydroxyglutarate aldolase/2-keto-3-deoxy-6-phosphogluconate aldolase n=1 Tax=Neobacillus sp. PS3-12 TaxID=3070677 RepID=UPI0027E03F55|nr:bifunctional 2-keto-4-hydroxyglutarate aldolase/2-keto-3-deoxy-6-phosphogluconate aldolase [Neobacillus sp. PS3-12]WML54483.1 bifunctional 2-keto-4-hydroxyglutarate aldolase/2-keto-3-deoxy-6-phosphogluconate aldolase [Neobacillus sp. PS3-12]
MLQKYEVLNEMHKGYLVAVIRGKNKEDAVEISKQVFKGGIRSLEVTFSTPGAEDAIAELSRLGEPQMIVGAGTVLDEETARIAIMKGARYVVSPHFDGSIATMCNRYSIPYLPGCGSVTEIMQALTFGVDVCKLFPGSLLGPSFIKDVKGPIPHVQLMPSGGVSLDNIDKWVNNGAFAVGIGSALTKGVTADDYSSVQKVASQFMDKLASINATQ